MNRIGLAVIIGLGIQTLLFFGVRGHFGPCGPSDVFGEMLLILELPAFWLVGWLHLHGGAENVAFFLIPVPIYAAIAWFCISGVIWFKRWNAAGPK